MVSDETPEASWFEKSFMPSDFPGASPPQGAFTMHPCTVRSDSYSPTIRSWPSRHICLSWVKASAWIHSSRRVRIVVAEHVESATRS